MTKRLYEIATKISQTYTDKTAEELQALMVKSALKDDKAIREALNMFFEPLAARCITRKKPTLVSMRKAQREVADVEKSVRVALTTGFLKATKRLSDALLLPDGRLFMDVPYYEHGDLRRTFGAWSIVIDKVRKKAVVTNQNMTPRQVITEADLVRIVSQAGLPGINLKDYVKKAA